MAERASGSGRGGGSAFERNGLAALSDLSTPEWGTLFAQLEREQGDFLARADAFRSASYSWPADALHTWSRVWEYPYAYDHLKRWRASQPLATLPIVAEVGSGVTFFPFALARLGVHVVCTDRDPVCGVDLPAAAHVVPHAPGSVTFRPTDGTALPFRDGEVDAVCCISVLEHIPTFETTVAEIARILRPGGVFVLTVDLDLRGDATLGVARYRDLRNALGRYFEAALPEPTVHPADLLTSFTGPYPMVELQPWARRWFLWKQRIKPWVGRTPLQLGPTYRLAACGAVLRRAV